MALHAYLAGLRRAPRLWPMAVVLFLANIAAGLCTAALAWHWLDSALDGSAATQTLLTHLDLNVFVDLVAYHGESMRTLLATAAVIAVAFVAVGAWCNAVVAVSVTADTGLAESLRRGTNLVPACLALASFMWLLQGASVAGGVILSRSAVRWAASNYAETTHYAALGSGIMLSGGLLFVLTTVHDHARIRIAAVGTGAIEAFGWSLRFVSRHVAKTLSLTLLLLATGVVVWFAYQVVAARIPVTSRAGLAVSILWGEGFVFVRMLVRVGAYASTRDLQRQATY
jgi:hypothetical protein